MSKVVAKVGLVCILVPLLIITLAPIMLVLLPVLESWRSDGVEYSVTSGHWVDARYFGMRCRS